MEFVILGNIMNIVKANEDPRCVIGIGECGNDCEQRCEQSHPGSQGNCDYTVKPPLCSCYYDCSPPSPPPAAPKCHEDEGECSIQSCNDQCCMDKCHSKYAGKSEVSGACQDVIGISTRLCVCEYDC